MAKAWLAVGVGLCAGGLAWGADTPAQFKAWGQAAGVPAPLPPGWKEVSPPADDLRPLQDGLSKEAEAKGFLLFSRTSADLLYPGSFPREDDLAGEVRAFASLGEYEPLQIGLRALRDLQGIALRLGNLKGPNGAELDAGQFDIRVVRTGRVIADAGKKEYVVQPLALEKAAAVDISAGRTQAFWITACVQPDTRPGDYRGTLVIRGGGADLAEMAVRFKVLPLRLKRPPQMYSMWYYEKVEDETMYHKVSRDMWEHGMNASWPSFSGAVGQRDKANMTRLLPPEHIAPMLAGAERTADFWLKSEFARHPRPSLGTPNLNWVNSHWDQDKGWEVEWPLNDKLDANVLNLVQMLEDVKKRKGLPEILYYLYDEAGAHPDTFPFALHYYKLLKEKFPQLKTYTTIGGGTAMGLDEIGQLAPVVDVLSSNRISERIVRDIRARKREFHIYNGGSNCAGSPAKDRLFFGFYGWKTTATGLGQWAHILGRLDARPFLDAGASGYCFPSPEGPVPTLHWEALREGVDDMAYTATLWDLIARARKDGQAGAKKEAGAAEESLAKIEALLPIPKEKTETHCQSVRLSPHVLDRWRWRVAGHILRLHELMGLGTGPGGETSFPLREYKYAAGEADSPKLGAAELIPDGAFENGPGVWSVQPWKGSGTGAHQNAVAHRGKGAVMMTNSAGAQDTLVCVWYAPKAELQAGKTYRFSAWVKPEGVALGARLRVKGREYREGNSVSGSQAWQALTCDFTCQEKETPAYLAVVMQGAGTAWVDDLSLRELLVEHKALSVNLGADEFHVSAPGALVEVRLDLAGAATAGLAVSLRVLADKGTEALRVSEPARGANFRMRLPLAKLRAGSYALVAELKDGTDKVLGSDRARFELTLGPFSPSP